MNNEPPLANNPIRSAQNPLQHQNVRVFCPNCAAPQQVPGQDNQVHCGHCGVIFRIPPSQAGAQMSGAQMSGNQGVLIDPVAARQFMSQRIPAGICGILIGGFGVHKFILGLNNAGVIMLVVSLSGIVSGGCAIFPILGTMAMGIIGIVEGILYLTKTDDEFYQIYAIEKKQWF